MNYADTGFLVSLYLPETTTGTATAEIARVTEPLAFTPLLRLELRNAFNFAIARRRLTLAKRDAIWRLIEIQREDGFFLDLVPPTSDLYTKAVELSDRHTPTLATRSLDLVHVATAVIISAQTFLSFDDRQRRAASAEGLRVRP